MREVSEQLTRLKSELETEVANKLPELRVWHAKCRPIVSQHFPNETSAFDKHVNFPLSQPRIKISSALPPGTLDRPKVQESLKKDQERMQREDLAKVKQAKSKIIAQLEGLISLGPIAPINSQNAESINLFSDLRGLVSNSIICQTWQDVIEADLNEAENCYLSESFKGCVVMLGAALEGALLATLQRSDLQVSLVQGTSQAPAKIRNIGINDPNLSSKIAENLSFEDYKVCVTELIPELRNLGVDNIQEFRNAIHPWKAKSDPAKYHFDQARALHYVASLKKIFDILHTWSP